MAHRKRLIVLAVVCLLAAVPLGGFLFGFQHCSDCGARISARLFMGCIYAVLTIIGMGTPTWKNDPNDPAPESAWPEISAIAIMLFALALFGARLKDRRAKRAGSSEHAN